MDDLILISTRDPETAEADVVLVHGVDGDAYGTWNDQRTSAFWPARLAEDCPRLNVWSLAHDASIYQRGDRSIPLVDQAVASLAVMDEKRIGRGRSLCFVAHSLGGVLVKQMLRRAAESLGEYTHISESTRGIVFLATPHTGSLLATLARFARAFPRSPLSGTVDEMQHAEPQLRELAWWYRTNARPLQIATQSYRETQKTNGVLVVDAVSADPAIVGSSTVPVKADHRGVAKFDTRNATYSRIRTFILGCVTGTDAVSGGPHSRELAAPSLDRFQALITERTTDFVGRDYVFDALGGFVAANRSGYVVIEGEPGAGKTSIIAELFSRTGCVVHFNMRGQGIDTHAQFLESVRSQLAARGGKPPPAVPTDATDFGAYFAELLARQRRQLGGNERLTIGIDALDEVRNEYTEGSVLALPADLPERVFLVVSRRPMPMSFVVNAASVTIDLGDYRGKSIEDVEALVHKRYAERETLRREATRRGIAAHALAELLGDRSQGNFMYAHYVLLDLEAGRLEDFAVNALPLGLEAYYEDHWTRMGMRASPPPRDKIRIVYVLAEARAAVSRRFISAVLQADPIDVQAVLDEWRAFLSAETVRGERRYTFYHDSFREFLHSKDIVESSGVTIPAINRLLLDHLERALAGHG